MKLQWSLHFLASPGKATTIPSSTTVTLTTTFSPSEVGKSQNSSVQSSPSGSTASAATPKTTEKVRNKQQYNIVPQQSKSKEFSTAQEEYCWRQS